MSATMGECTAIVLAGGGSRRFEASDKLLSDIGGIPLVSLAVMAAAGCSRIIVVGPPGIKEAASRAAGTAELDVTVVQESPPGGGPVAAIAAGLGLATTPTILVLAGDLPFASGLPETVIGALVDDDEAPDAVVPIDAKGHRQPLAAAYRASALIRALTDIGQLHGASMRALLERLDVVELPSKRVPEHSLLDIDTASDLAIARDFDSVRGGRRP